MTRAAGLARAAGGFVALVLALTPRTSRADGPHPLSLADAIQTALASDADLYMAREDALAAEDGIALARAPFSSHRLFGEAAAAREDLPPSVRSYGASDRTLATSIGIAGALETGLTYQLSAGLARQSREDRLNAFYRPATTLTVRGELIQPLLRGAFSAARRPIVVASRRRDQREQELRARIERTVGAVEVAYWNLVRAHSERDARASALELAKEQVEESKRLARLGSSAELDIVEAESGASRLSQELLRAEQAVVEADGLLFATMGVRTGDAGWRGGGPIDPTDKPQLEPRTLEVDAQLALARARRADVLAAQGQTAAEQAQLGVAEDRTRPALDIVARVGTAGFGGVLVPTADPSFRNPVYEGGLSTALQNTLGQDLQFYVGLRFEVALGDDEAQARHAIQRRTVSRAQLAERQTLAQIETEVRMLITRVELAVRLIEAAENAIAIADKLLEGTRKRFRAGARTSFDVLRVTEELTRARVEAARARADYRVALTRLDTATGTLLDQFNITLKSLGATPR